MSILTTVIRHSRATQLRRPLQMQTYSWKATVTVADTTRYQLRHQRASASPKRTNCIQLEMLQTTLSHQMNASSSYRYVQTHYWVGCANTRKSTAGVIVQVLNSTLHRRSKTRPCLAASSGESELNALGSATSEALHLRTCLIVSESATRVHITIHTDITTATSIPTRHGSTKATRHVHHRYLLLHDIVATRAIQYR